MNHAKPPALSDAEIARRFNYQVPGEDVQKTMVRLRHAYTTLARTVAEELEPGREASLAFTHLEQSLFYAIGALARNQAAPGGEAPFDLLSAQGGPGVEPEQNSGGVCCRDK